MTLYWCDKCERNHRDNSGVGQKHFPMAVAGLGDDLCCVCYESLDRTGSDSYFGHKNCYDNSTDPPEVLRERFTQWLIHNDEQSFKVDPNFERKIEVATPEAPGQGLCCVCFEPIEVGETTVGMGDGSGTGRDGFFGHRVCYEKNRHPVSVLRENFAQWLVHNEMPSFKIEVATHVVKKIDVTIEEGEKLHEVQR